MFCLLLKYIYHRELRKTVRVLEHILNAVSSLVGTFGKLPLDRAGLFVLDVDSCGEKFSVFSLVVISHQVRKFEVDVVFVSLNLAILSCL